MAQEDTGRARIELTLKDAPFPNGEIPLSRMSEIATRTQALIHRLARTLTERSGPGRSPGYVEKAAELSLTGIREGSTVLEIAGPAMQAELDFGDIPPDVGKQALIMLLDGIDAVVEGRALPDAFDDRAREALSDWFEPFSDTSEFNIHATIGGRTYERALIAGAAHERLAGITDSTQEEIVHSEYRTVEGTLYSLNLRSHRFSIEDDTGLSISLEINLPADDVRPLVGRRVRVTGQARTDAKGHVTVTADELELAGELEGLDTRAFFTRTELDELLAETQPVASIGALAIDGLSEEEADAFFDALTNGR